MIADVSQHDIPYNSRQNIVPCIINHIKRGYFTLGYFKCNKYQSIPPYSIHQMQQAPYHANYNYNYDYNNYNFPM